MFGRATSRALPRVVAVSLSLTLAPSASIITHSESSSADPTVVSRVGNTALVRLNRVSAVTGCEVLAKAEYMNPGGSVKDRPALNMLLEAEESGALKPGMGIFEASGGNTAVALALLGQAKGYPVTVCLPETISKDKIDVMKTYGATVVLCPCVGFDDPRHYYHTAGRLATEAGGFYTNQFENLANSNAHFKTTAPEILRQADGPIDALVLASGTGGTIGGLSAYFKAHSPATRVVLIDPPGSSLASFVRSGGSSMDVVPGSTVAEGIGINRITANFSRATVDDAIDGDDVETVEMMAWLLKHENVHVGPSAALNVCGAVKVARKLGPGHRIVTILCDSGDRYRRSAWDAQWLAKRSRTPTHTQDADLGFIR